MSLVMLEFRRVNFLETSVLISLYFSLNSKVLKSIQFSTQTSILKSLEFSDLADLLNGNQPVSKPQAGTYGTSDFSTQINLLAENVQSLLDRNQTIDEEIQSVKSKVQSMTNQIHQINVRSI